MAADPNGDVKIDRKLFAEMWSQLETIAQPHRTALHEVGVAQDLLCELTNGREPVAWCEVCGNPFFDNDDFVRSEDGVSQCRRYDEPAGPCYEPT